MTKVELRKQSLIPVLHPACLMSIIANLKINIKHSCPVMLFTRKSHYFFLKINEFVVNLLVIEVSTLNLAHIIRMRKYVFSEILVAMVTVF